MGYYYQYEVKHEGLNKYKIVKGRTKLEAKQKADALLNQWDEMYQNKIKAQEKIFEKNKEKELIEIQILQAQVQTVEAQLKIEKLKNYLLESIEIKPIEFETILNHFGFNEIKPILKLPYLDLTEPKPEGYPANLNIWDKLFPSGVEYKKKAAEENYHQAVKNYNDRLNKNTIVKKNYEKDLVSWQKKTKELLNQKQVTDVMEFIISKAYYPDIFIKDFMLDFNNENQVLIIDFKLPEVEDFPKIKEVKFIKTQRIFNKKFFPEKEIRDIYDDFMYQVSLKVINDVYKHDYANKIKSVVFNGWVETIDKKKGKEITLCIMSVQASMEEFLSINLAKVDPKECFKGLKGIGCLKLHTTTPIAPIIQINKEDKRFIASYEVLKDIDSSQNIAAMDWEDFEHLIREIFEKEFSRNGGEVKVTQSSRDGGVDAIAFDPDPIRGGKIVIQAKRYTNVVGVSAIRDLYGTVHNEGAIKGIIVTTSDYGSDAYNFAKDKPLSLLNGGNLLQLLEKHGHNARIDIKEAKLLLGEQINHS